MVRVASCSGTFEIGISPSDYIDDLKTKILEREGIPQDQQRLIFGGRQLESGLTLLDHGIVLNESMIHLALRLCGC